MKIYKYLSNLLLIVCCLTVITACGDNSDSKNDPVVGARISNPNISDGDSFDIVIIMDNFPLSRGGGFSLRFNPAVIRIDCVVIDPSWEFASQVGGIDNIGGEVTDVLFTSFTGNSGWVKVATICATAVGTGTSAIEFVESTINPFAGASQPLAVTFETNSVEVN